MTGHAWRSFLAGVLCLGAAGLEDAEGVRAKRPGPLSSAESPGAAGLFLRHAVGEVGIGAESPGAAGLSRSALASLVRDLDSRYYEVRQRAARKLEGWIARPEAADLLAAEFQRLLVDPGVSFEVRSRVAGWRGRLPQPSAAPPPSASPSELDRLVRQVDDDTFAVRVGAGERLRWLAGNPLLVGPILVRLKQRLLDADLSIDGYRRFDAVRQVVWGHWLAGGEGPLDLPPVSNEQVDRWLDDLSRPAEQSRPAAGEAPRSPSGPVRRQIAKQELLELLAQDREVDRVRAAIQRRLDSTTDADAAARLRELVELCRPAMVAECWMHRRLMLPVQHLLVGVPSQIAGAVRPSHFDRVDDRVAHCVSGNSLSPGNYPVGVAIPHPKQADAVFHLINLPTPRRRMAYPYLCQTDQAQRLAALSRRTLARFLAEKHALGHSEACMLAQLDPREVSRFAGRYFRLVEDAPLEDEYPPDGVIVMPSLPGGRSSLHGAICTVLAMDGTKDAGPALLEAIQEKRILPPTAQAPYQMPWLAGLSIAGRDPWTGVDAWLGGLIGRGEPLVLGHPEGPELGATAARLLLQRHGESPGLFELEQAADPVLANLHVEGYRFRRSEAAGRVLAWWKRQAAALPPGPGRSQAP
jgi:hypothetical protein